MADELVIRINGDVKDYQNALNEVNNSTKELQGQLEKIAKPAAVAFTALTVAMGLSANEFRKYEKALVGVGKTTDLSGKALEKFGKDITKLSKEAPITANELLGIAEAAGQLGVTGEENLLKFTETMAKLGVSTDLHGQEAATALTRILTITKEGVKDIDIFGSQIVALGNSFAASESEIVRMASEISKATAVFGISAGESAAFGATLKSIGVRAELGGSAVGRAFRAIDSAVRKGGDELKDLEKITGKTGDEITKIFQNNAPKAFQLFINGLGDIARANGDTTKELEKFGLKGEEILKVLPALALNSDLLGKAIETQANEAKNATALNDEAAKAYNTLDAIFITMKNSINAVSIEFGAFLANDIIPLIQNIKMLAKNFADLDDDVKSNIFSFIKWAAIISGAVAGLATAGILVLKISAGIAALSAIFLPASIAASAFWAALTGPIGIAIAGIVGITAAVVGLWEAFKDPEPVKNLEDINRSLENKKMQLKVINDMIEKGTILNIKGAEADRDRLKAEIAGLEELKNKRIEAETTNAKAGGFEDDTAKEEKKLERIKTLKELEIEAEIAKIEALKALQAEEFEASLEKLDEDQELLTEKKLENLELENEALEEFEIEKKARELESKGKHDEAVALIDKFRIERQIKESKEEIERNKVRDAKILKAKETLAKMKRDLEVKTASASIDLASNTANFLVAVQGKQTAASFILGKIAAVGQIMLSDSMARAAATTASALASTAVAIVPGAGPAAFEANMTFYQGLITANTALALGTVAAQTIKGFAKGGLVEGGIPGVDSVPIMAQQGELIVPAGKDFDTVIGSVRAQREAEEFGGGAGGNIGVHVTYDSPEASQIITISQVEDTALGISRDSFKEAI